MSALGIFDLIAGLLQLVIPSYALRLVRRFGAQRVGWFLVAAFASLAALRLTAPTTTLHGLAAPGIRLDLVVAFASGLLLIGLGHIDTLLSERQQAQREGQNLERKLELAVTERTAELADANAKLQQEIALRDRHEKVLKESEAQYRLLFTENPQPMLIFDLRNLGFLAVNHAALHQYGFSAEEFQCLTARELVPADAAAAFLEEVTRPCSGAQARGVWRHCRRDLGLIEVEITAADLRFRGCPARLVVAQDVSQRRQRELELRQVQRTELIGRLAGGFGHEFNKLLTVIDSQAKLLQSHLQDTKALGPIEKISTAATRAGRLTSQLLAASGRQSIRPEPMDLNRLISSLSPMLQRLIGERIVLQSALGSGLPPILADAHAVEHILINLLLNARDAMRAGGTLTIQTAVTRVEKHQAQGRPGAKVGEFLRLGVRDTGCGMDPEVQAHLFEPFFTTHDSEAATGLGLASVWGAINQQAGWIEFTTEVGVGTEFQVYFPCARPVAAAVPGAPQSLRPSARGTVLLVEPDHRIRGLVRYGLNRNGYHVIEADCAETVLWLWGERGANVELMLMDERLPGISSGELARKLRQTKPDLRIVCTTAHPSPCEDPQPLPIEGAETLLKPYTVDQLLQVVRAAWPKPAGS